MRDSTYSPKHAAEMQALIGRQPYEQGSGRDGSRQGCCAGCETRRNCCPSLINICEHGEQWRSPLRKGWKGTDTCGSMAGTGLSSTTQRWSPRGQLTVDLNVDTTDLGVSLCCSGLLAPAWFAQLSTVSSRL